MYNLKNNIEQVETSPIIAKIAVRKNGQVEIMAVYQESPSHEFYWTYRVKSPRTPRKKWKKTVRYLPRTNPYFYKTLDEFIDFLKKQGYELLSVRVHSKRLLAGLFEKTRHEFLTQDWQPAPQEGPMTFYRGEQDRAKTFGGTYNGPNYRTVVNNFQRRNKR